jgi:hypothetical protein
MPVFGQGQFVRVYGRQGKLDKCTIEKYFYDFGKQKAAIPCTQATTELVKENLSKKTCQGKLVDRTHKLVKRNLSRKKCSSVRA